MCTVEDYWDVVGQAVQVRHSKTNQNVFSFAALFSILLSWQIMSCRQEFPSHVSLNVVRRMSTSGRLTTSTESKRGGRKTNSFLCTVPKESGCEGCLKRLAFQRMKMEVFWREEFIMKRDELNALLVV